MTILLSCSDIHCSFSFDCSTNCNLVLEVKALETINPDKIDISVTLLITRFNILL